MAVRWGLRVGGLLTVEMGDSCGGCADSWHGPGGRAWPEAWSCGRGFAQVAGCAFGHLCRLCGRAGGARSRGFVFVEAVLPTFRAELIWACGPCRLGGGRSDLADSAHVGAGQGGYARGDEAARREGLVFAAGARLAAKTRVAPTGAVYPTDLPGREPRRRGLGGGYDPQRRGEALCSYKTDFGGGRRRKWGRLKAVSWRFPWIRNKDAQASQLSTGMAKVSSLRSPWRR